MNAEKYTITNLTRYLNKIPDIIIRYADFHRLFHTDRSPRLLTVYAIKAADKTVYTDYDGMINANDSYGAETEDSVL